jgi:hypothetical protein
MSHSRPLIEAAKRRACLLVDEGVSPDRAVEQAVRWAHAQQGGWCGTVYVAPEVSGFGQIEILKQAAESEPVKAVRETVSPWLWALSVIGFGMAVLNTQRIAKMYRSWKEKRS